MPRKKYTPEEIVAKLRQVDVLVSQGRLVALIEDMERAAGNGRDQSGRLRDLPAIRLRFVDQRR